jgi:hypothetical protein
MKTNKINELIWVPVQEATKTIYVKDSFAVKRSTTLRDLIYKTLSNLTYQEIEKLVDQHLVDKTSIEIILRINERDHHDVSSYMRWLTGRVLQGGSLVRDELSSIYRAIKLVDEEV